MFRSRIRLVGPLGLLLLLWLSVPAAALNQGATDWVVVAPAGEGFSVSLPIKPQEQTERMALMGNSYQMRLYTSVDEADGLLYMTIMQEFPSLFEVLTPSEKLDKFMEGFEEGFSQSIGSADTKFDLQPDRDLDLEGQAGRQYKLTFGETRGLVRCFDGKLRMYVVLVMGADEENSNVVRFFNSFELKPAPAPVPQPVSETKP